MIPAPNVDWSGVVRGTYVTTHPMPFGERAKLEQAQRAMGEFGTETGAAFYQLARDFAKSIGSEDVADEDIAAALRRLVELHSVLDTLEHM